MGSEMCIRDRSQNVSEAYTAPAKGDGSTVLDRYDNVVITVTK